MDGVDVVAQMAALGLPSSFVASIKQPKKKKSKRRSIIPTIPIQIPTIVHTYSTSINGGTKTTTVESLECEELEFVGSTECPVFLEGGTRLENVDQHVSLSETVFVDTVEEQTKLDTNNTCQSFDFDSSNIVFKQGVWQAAWDALYKTWFFYNTLTKASQWEVPDGFDWSSDSVFFSSDLSSPDETQSSGDFKAGQNAGHSGNVSIQPHKQAEMDTETERDTSYERESVAPTLPSRSAGKSGTVEPVDEGDIMESTTSLLFKDRTDIHLTRAFVPLSDTGDAEPAESEENSERIVIEEVLMTRETLVLSSDPVVSDTENIVEYQTSVSILDKSKSNQTSRRVGHSKKIFEAPIEVGKLLEGTAEATEGTLVAKYWHQRYALFSKFDDGIVLDVEGWYSVTPEAIAMHHAQRCSSSIIVDAFTGCGGNAIQFAFTCDHVIAVDIDPIKIDLARRNATIYGVDNKIEFVVGDFLKLAPKLKADVVFMSPPWGGPQYLREDTYDLESMMKPCSGFELFKIAKQIAPSVVFFVPRNVNMEQLEQLASSSSPKESYQVEKNFLNGKLKTVTAYYGPVVRKICFLECCR